MRWKPYNLPEDDALAARSGSKGRGTRGLLPRYQKLPWIPSDQEWQHLLHGLGEERLRTQVMLMLAYDGALRREELVRLEMSDFDFAYQQIRASRAREERTRTHCGL